MPGRDGLSAARAIRRGNNPNVNTPIVALTAHVSSDTATWIEKAGMDAYLTKPISRDRLLRVVHQYGLATPTEIDSFVGIDQPNVEVDSASDDLPIMDFDQFNDYFGNYSGNKKVRLLSALLDDLKRNKSRASDAIKALDEDTARAAAHALLGSSAAIGAERLSRLSQQIEYSPDHGSSFDWDACRALINLINLTVREVERMMEKVSVEEKITSTHEEFV